MLHTTGTADTEIFTIPIETEIFTISNSSPNTAPNSTPQVPSLSPNTTPFTKSSSIRSTTNSGSTYAESEYHWCIYDKKTRVTYFSHISFFIVSESGTASPLTSQLPYLLTRSTGSTGNI